MRMRSNRSEGAERGKERAVRARSVEGNARRRKGRKNQQTRSKRRERKSGGRGKSERAISLLLSLARASGDSIAGHALGSRRERDKPNSRRRTLERAMATNVGGKEREKEWFRSFFVRIRG